METPLQTATAIVHAAKKVKQLAIEANVVDTERCGGGKGPSSGYALVVPLEMRNLAH